MLPIRSLLIIQDELRNPEQIPDMFHFVKDGGNFSESEQLIEIAAFDDGKWYIHNGHHRAVAMFLAGRKDIYDNEYYFKHWKYEDYNSICFHNPDGTWRGYVTPFDIKTETRIADLAHHKQTVKKVYDLHGEEATRLYIKQTRPLYCKPKQLHTVKDLAHEYLRNNGPTIARRHAQRGFRI